MKKILTFMDNWLVKLAPVIVFVCVLLLFITLTVFFVALIEHEKVYENIYKDLVPAKMQVEYIRDTKTGIVFIKYGVGISVIPKGILNDFPTDIEIEDISTVVKRGGKK